MTCNATGSGWIRSEGSEKTIFDSLGGVKPHPFFFLREDLFIMAENRIENRRKRLGEINDRKIEILLEFGLINKRIEELKSEYSRLDKEYYELWLNPI
jgi:hypothetical protein